MIAPPPLPFLGFLALGLVADYAFGGPGLGAPSAFRYVVGAACIAAAAALLVGAVWGFRAAGTRPEPWKPTTALVFEGVYRFTRNPMYLAMALAFLGIAVLADSLLTLVLLAPSLILIRYGVIGREEQYLERRFGEPYRAYKAKVRRWL